MKESHDLATLLEKGNFRAKALKALRDALAATRSFNQNGQTKTEPDYKTRVRAAEILLSYTDGKPIERQLISISGQQREESAEEHAERIAAALRLPPGRGKAILAAKIKENGHANGEGVQTPRRT
jgi:hypothetical protein